MKFFWAFFIFNIKTHLIFIINVTNFISFKLGCLIKQIRFIVRKFDFIFKVRTKWSRLDSAFWSMLRISSSIISDSFSGITISVGTSEYSRLKSSSWYFSRFFFFSSSTMISASLLGRGILIQSLPLLLGPGGRGGIGNINKNDKKI